MADDTHTSREQLELELAQAKERVASLESRLAACYDPLSGGSGPCLQDKILSSLDIVAFHGLYEDGCRFDYIGASVAEVTGFSSEAFLDDNGFWLSHIHPEDVEKVTGRFKRLRNTAYTRCEYRWQVASGDYRWFSLSVRLLPCDEEGMCVSGVFWDITDRKRTEKALIEREQRYRTVADFTHDWEFWVGPDGSFLYVSPSFERVTGYRPDELKSNPSLLFDTIVHPLDRDVVRNSIMDGLLSHELLTLTSEL